MDGVQMGDVHRLGVFQASRRHLGVEETFEIDSAWGVIWSTPSTETFCTLVKDAKTDFPVQIYSINMLIV